MSKLSPPLGHGLSLLGVGYLLPCTEAGEEAVAEKEELLELYALVAVVVAQAVIVKLSFVLLILVLPLRSVSEQPEQVVLVAQLLMVLMEGMGEIRHSVAIFLLAAVVGVQVALTLLAIVVGAQEAHRQQGEPGEVQEVQRGLVRSLVFLGELTAVLEITMIFQVDQGALL